DVGGRKCDVVRRQLRSAHCGVEHPFNDRNRTPNRMFSAVHDEITAFDTERDGNRTLERREVLIEFPKEPEVVVEAA
ncbi:MAG: hypothetical protein JO165_13245, partial [Candidatus Eremiobacteraeota bacterium]|nr:hypothetical protein [Candidatus Eremiobacteraeota bacterium]